MADFCQQCSIAFFGEDFGGMKGLGNGKPFAPDRRYFVFCESCGPVFVDDNGRCCSIDCAEQGHIIKGDVKHG